LIIDGFFNIGSLKGFVNTFFIIKIILRCIVIKDKIRFLEILFNDFSMVEIKIEELNFFLMGFRLFIFNLGKMEIDFLKDFILNIIFILSF
jgi:hypothetical protein